MFSAAVMTAMLASASAMPTPESFFGNTRKVAALGKRTGIDGKSMKVQAKNDGSTGWYEVQQFVEDGACEGSSITEFYEYGNCVMDNDGDYSMLDISGPTDNVYVFNRTFYADDLCDDNIIDHFSFTLPTVCEANTTADNSDMMYGISVVGLSTKLTIAKKTMGYIAWNTADACDDDNSKTASYMLATNFNECYPNMNVNLTFESDDFYNGDDNMTMYGSMEMQSCSKARYYETDDCSGESVTLKNTVGEDDDTSACEMEDGEETDVEMYSTYYCKSKSKGKKNVCFAGSGTVLTESGATKLVSEIAIGDRVQVYSEGSMQFSDVIAVPHGKNSILSTFVQISTANGESVKMTPDHIVAAGACSADAAMLPLVRALEVSAGDCVHTTAGQSVVSSVEEVQEKGIYTFVTRAEFVVVGNIVASPFAVNHEILHFFYNLHRALPTDSPLVNVFHAVADQITKLAVMPGFFSVFAVSA